MKMKMLFVLVALAVPVAAQECPQGFDCAGMAPPAQRAVHQFELLKGTAQIGHVPGRIDVNRPEVKPLSLGENISLDLALRWQEPNYNPCSEAEGCIATVGLRHRSDGFVDTWTTYTFTTDTQVMKMNLFSKSDDHVLPCGHHDVFVRITGRGHTLGVWYVPVAIHVDRCPGE